MYWQYLIDTLQLNDNPIFNNKIKPVTTIQLKTFVDKG
jgi:hypothetical protein